MGNSGHTAPDDVLEFWFGRSGIPEDRHRNRWFAGGQEVDAEIQQRFSETHERLVSQPVLSNEWLVNGRSLLAAIIVIDQFSRNIYRQQAKAFQWDARAVEWSLTGWQKQQFDNLTVSQKFFSLMPLMHSENIQHHEQLRSYASAIRAEHEGDVQFKDAFLSSAEEHSDIIRRFGRYPHRNAVLNRESTQEERDYLDSNSSRFGQ